MAIRVVVDDPRVQLISTSSQGPLRIVNTDPSAVFLGRRLVISGGQLIEAFILARSQDATATFATTLAQVFEKPAELVVGGFVPANIIVDFQLRELGAMTIVGATISVDLLPRLLASDALSQVVLHDNFLRQVFVDGAAPEAVEADFVVVEMQADGQRDIISDP